MSQWPRPSSLSRLHPSQKGENYRHKHCRRSYLNHEGKAEDRPNRQANDCDNAEDDIVNSLGNRTQRHGYSPLIETADTQENKSPFVTLKKAATCFDHLAV
jgi:hypothetical protein